MSGVVAGSGGGGVAGSGGGGHRNLVIVRAGESSLHEAWLEPAAARTFSLAVSYYGSHPGRWAASADRFVSMRGPKWWPIAEFVDANWDWVRQFDYVALPDDDVAATAADWAAVFRIMEELGLDLAQPSLDPQSHWTHSITTRRPAYRARYTNFVEVMAPVFSRWALRQLLPTFRMSVSGWGLDVAWPSILHESGGRVGIIDEVCVRHTRPFNGPGSTSAEGAAVYNVLGQDPHVDDMALMQVFGVAWPYDPVVYGAVPAGSGALPAEAVAV